MMKHLSRAALSLMFALILMAAPGTARADCTAAPVSSNSDLILSFKTVNGTQFAPAVTYTGGTGKEGMLIYEPTSKIMLLCDGTNWVTVGEGTYRGQLPGVFTFTTITGQYVSTVVTSNIVQVTGITVGVPVNVGGGNTPQYRICQNSSCTTVLTDWTANQNIIQKNQFLQLRQTTAAVGSTDATMTATVGLMARTWTARTDSQTTNAFDFLDVADATISTVTPSNTLTMSNPSRAPMSVSITGAGTPQFSINGGSWVTSGTVLEGQTLQLRLTSNATPLTGNTATVTVNGVSDTYTVTTATGAPAAYSFTDQTGVNVSTQISSNTITLTNAAAAPMAVSVSGDGSPQVSLNGGAWGTSGTLNSGQTLQMRLTSNASGTTANTATVSVAGVNSTWSVTTGSDTPGAFSFTDLTGQDIAAVVTSNAVTVTNPAGMPMTASVSGSGSPQLRIAGGSWGSGGSMNSGQTIEVRQTSSSSGNTAQTATVTINGVSTTWSVTTLDQLYSFSKHTFTTCGNSGQSGPALSSCQSVYANMGASWASSTSNLNVTSGIQLWTVPADGTYRITVAGAQGGDSAYSGWANYRAPTLGGTGAIMSGEFALTKGQQLRIVVGQRGNSTRNGSSTGYNTQGGGGGSFVLRGTSGVADILAIAGGGGGAASYQYSSSCGDTSSVGGGTVNANSSPVGGCYSTASSQGVGQGGGTYGTSYNGCAGGGLNSDGSCSGISAYWNYTPQRGFGFTNSLVGGNGDGSGGYTGWSAYGHGGFGGGGGGGASAPGGGGGYTGGNASGYWSSYASWGSGGGSINNGTNTANQSGRGYYNNYDVNAQGGNFGDGFVTISRVVTDTAPLYTFTAHTFTPCGATGRNGPTLGNCTSAYSAATWTANTSYFSMPQQGYQLWTVPQTAIYQIEAAGAKGADSANSGWSGGRGAIMRGLFPLVKGQQIRIVVGQQGKAAYSSGSYYNMSGGGGGTFVVAGTSGTSEPLVIAGGGGAAPSSSWSSSCSKYSPNSGGQASQSSVEWSCFDQSSSYVSYTPTIGYGGLNWNSSYPGCAGGGFLGNGACSSSANSGQTPTFGIGFQSTAVGGAGDGNGTTNGPWLDYGDGGFGGGGGGALGGPGAGGGYTGGSAGGSWSSIANYGQGGGSFNRGYSQANTTGSGYGYTALGNNGNGYVTITKQ